MDAGTSARTTNHPPVSIGTPPTHDHFRRTGHSKAVLPVLQKGEQNEYVRWLQILLDLHRTSKAFLKPDGYFGPKTLEAVLAFQKASGLNPDGIVGLHTWEKVQFVQAELPAHEEQATQHAAPAPQAVSAPAPVSVADWSLTRRFHEIVTVLVVKHLKPELAAQFRAMLTPVNITILVTTLVAWAVSHAFGVGEVADVIIAVVGTIFMGLAVFKAGYDIGDCMMITVGAKEYPDLDRAADKLAEAIAILGVVAFFALIAKVGAKLRSKGSPAGGGAGDEGAPPEKGSKPSGEDSDSPAKPPKANLMEPRNGITPDRVLAGDPNKVAVIGRSMGQAVNPYAEGLSAEGYNVETFSGDKISPEANAEWNDLRASYNNKIPDDVLPNTKMYQENQAWAQKLANQGYTVVDVGNPANQGPSVFYEMEKSTIFGD